MLAALDLEDDLGDQLLYTSTEFLYPPKVLGDFRPLSLQMLPEPVHCKEEKLSGFD